MAGEINFSVILNASKNGLSIALPVSGSADLAGSEMIGSVQTLSTSPAAVSIGGCDQIQAIAIKNLDAAIAVTIGLDTPITQVVSVIPAGKAILLWGPPSTLYAKSASGTPDISVVAVET